MNRLLTRFFTVWMLLHFLSVFAQTETATVKGTITTSAGKPVANASVSYDDKGTVSDKQGHYVLKIPAGISVELLFSHVSFQEVHATVKLKPGAVKTLNIEVLENVENINDVVIRVHKKNTEGITDIKVETIKTIPSSSNSLKEVVTGIGLGASSDNELSSQYKVRGGNYDENLVYVNGIEVYRPFLIRSGKQEGLGFVNTDMTDHVKFSSGGFQAAYGDKMSSVLDITYRQPEKFSLIADLSLTGASLTTDLSSNNHKTGGILGLRYKNNSLLVNKSDYHGDYFPVFTDAQLFVTHHFNPAWKLSFLGNLSVNKYHYEPHTRSTKFGSLLNPLELFVHYEGNENDDYITGFSALQLAYRINTHWNMELTGSAFRTNEREYFDIFAQYSLGEPNTDAGNEDFGQSDNLEQIGEQYDHARNDLDALIGGLQLKTNFRKGKFSLNAGLGFRTEDIRDRLIEWQMIDSAGFAVRPPGHDPNMEPYEAYEGPLTPFQSLRSKNHSNIRRFTGYVQWKRHFKNETYELWTNVGTRVHFWQIDHILQQVISPRAIIGIKPAWKRDMIFRLSGGLYAQPPMYREMRDFNGILHPEVKAQKSWHIVLGSDYGFQMWNRPFKLVAEAYYKYLTDVNPYNLDNVRIRYAAENNAVAYATGFDFRINGEFVPGTESWFNFGFLKTEENIDGKGYISRPTDQRLKFALLFQDYVPTIPKLKMYMNLIYNTGVPGGSPAYSDPYDFQSRLGDYKRVDLGIFYIFKDAENPGNRHWLSRFKELSLGGEIFNLFDITNSITNTWVRDIYSKRMYAVRNYMTGRVFNLRIKMRL